MEKYGIYFRLAVSAILAALGFGVALVFGYKGIDMPTYLEALITALVGGFVFEAVLTKAGNKAKSSAKAAHAKVTGKPEPKATDSMVGTVKP